MVVGYRSQYDKYLSRLGEDYTSSMEAGDEITTHPLLTVLGDHPRTRILLAFFTAGLDAELQATEILARAELSTDGLYNHLDDLVTEGILHETQTTGHITFYTLNTEYPTILHLHSAFQQGQTVINQSE